MYRNGPNWGLAKFQSKFTGLGVSNFFPKPQSERPVLGHVTHAITGSKSGRDEVKSGINRRDEKY